MLTRIKSLLREDDGATMVEYGLMLALIAVVCIATITTLGGRANNQFETVNAALQ